MTDLNAYQPIAGQSKITVMVEPDIEELALRLSNGEKNGKKCYPGGSKKENLAILQHEVLGGLKGNADYEAENVFSSLNGFNYGNYGSLYNAQNNTYFAGVSQSTYEFMGNDVNHGEPLSGGISCQKAGTKTVVNTGLKDIYAGDTVVMKLPNPKRNFNKAIQPTGTSASKALFETTSFDASDFNVEVSGLLYSMFERDEDPMSAAIGYMGVHDALMSVKNGEIQEQAAHLQAASLIKGLRMIESLVRMGWISINSAKADGVTEKDAYDDTLELAENIGLFKTKNDIASTEDDSLDTIKEVLSDMYVGSSIVGEDHMDDARERFKAATNKSVDNVMMSNPDLKTNDQVDRDGFYQKLAVNAHQIEWGAYTKVLMCKTSRIMGVALDYAQANNGSLNMMLGYQKIGF